MSNVFIEQALIVAAGFALTYLLWVLYLAVMNLQRARDAGTLSKVALCLGLPLLWFGLFVDFLVNALVMTVVLFELPQEWLVTSRLKRHKAGSGWRHSFACWMGDHLLDPFDPSGKHL